MKTFVYKHRLAYIVDYCKHASMYVKVAINYPLLPGLLKHYLHEKLSLNQDRKVDISMYPAVQGYYIEAEFFNHSCMEVAINQVMDIVHAQVMDIVHAQVQF